MLNFYADPSIKEPVVGDPSRLRQVLINLLSNAIKFTSAGVVDFQMDVREINADNTTVYFQVTDTGIGMTPEQIAIIFDPFTQAESGNTRKYGGTGLGLTITKNIIEFMGGNIAVDSTPGTGSKFSFKLKFDFVKPDKDTSDAKNMFHGLKKPIFEGEVLLCEDNDLNQQVAFEFLSRIGLQTVIAKNGQIGLEKVRERIEKGEKMFDVIFMDIHMPVMDGLEASTKILELDKDIPIVAMTANIMPDDVETYIKKGMRECLGKPFTSQELWNCLMNYLEPVDWQVEDAVQYDVIDDELRRKLINRFIEINSNVLCVITGALDAGDFKLAHRLIHSLKTHAGQLKKDLLVFAAEEVENNIKDGENLVTPEQLKALELELNAALKDFSSQVAETAIAEGGE